MRHPLTHVGAGRYRTRTARAERSEGNQSPGGALISARFPMRRNVYQERCRQTFWSGDFFRGGGTGREPGQAKAEYHHDGGILPFALHPPILCVSGQSLRMSVRTYAGKRESSDI